MKPYVGIVGLRTQEELIGAATDFYNAGFSTITDTPLSHNPALIFDYNADIISSESQLDEFNESVQYAKTMIKNMTFGIRYRLPRKYAVPGEKYLSALIKQLPGIDFFEFSHMYPSRRLVSNLNESFPDLAFVSHVGASNLIRGMLTNYFDKTPYEHHVFDTSTHGFKDISSYAERSIARKDSLGFAAKLDETDLFESGLNQIIKEVGTSCSFEARCLVKRGETEENSRLVSQNFITISSRLLLH